MTTVFENPMETFSYYLLCRTMRTDTPTGDFVYDARREIASGDWVEPSDWASLRRYLVSRRAGKEVLAAAYRVYKNYLRASSVGYLSQKGAA